VIGRYFDQDDGEAVRVLDPHLSKAPWLYLRPAKNASAGCTEPVMFSAHLPDLEPNLHRLLRWAGRTPGDFQQSAAEKEHHRRVGRGTELPVDGQSEHVAVKIPALTQVSRVQQDAAAQYVHATVLPAEVALEPGPAVVAVLARGRGRPGSPCPAGRARNG
jgi:hypothetical protein